MYDHIFNDILNRIGVPMIGILHVGSHSNKFRSFYTNVLGTLTSSNYMVLDSTICSKDEDLSSLLSKQNICRKSFNTLTIDSEENIRHIQYLLRDSYFDTIHYVFIVRQHPCDHLFLDLNFRRVWLNDHLYLYRKNMNAYRFLPNDTLRLGNIIHTVIHLLYFAEETNSCIYFHFNPHKLFRGMFNTIYLPKVGIRKFEYPTAQLHLLEKNTSCFQVLAYQFYFNPPHIPPERVRRFIARNSICKCLPESNMVMPTNHLLIHIRSGDIFSDNVHKNYIQPPYQYYSYIISKYKYDEITIVTEPDCKNPVIQELLNHYNNVHVYHDDLETDVKRILSARHLVMGTGSFAHMLSICSQNIETLFCFQSHNVYYHEADYKIVVLGIDPIASKKQYPKYWTNDVNVLTDKDWVIKEMDMQSFHEIPTCYWDEFL